MWRSTSLGAAALALTTAAVGCAKGTGQSGTRDNSGGASASSGSDAGVGGALKAPCTRGEECAGLSDACNQGACVNGLCGRVPDLARESAPCEDGLYCTQQEACHNGVCEGGLPRVCPGADACNVGACDEATRSCAAAPGNEGQSCSSGELCTTDTTCHNGVCGGGTTRDCSVFDDLCSVGVCDPVTGCKPEMKGDGLPCDPGSSAGCYSAICEGGVCHKIPRADGTACALAGFDPCSIGVCQSAVCQAEPGNDGAPCDDGMFNPCTQGACSLGACKSGAVPDGVPCNDFAFCTVNDHCTTGVCGGDPNTCGPASPCLIFQCDEASQTCASVAGNDGAPCDDGSACTVGTTCAAGVCGKGTPTNEGGACVVGSCTTGDICTAGVCGGGQGPTIYFQDDFKDNSRGWLLGPEWQIGPAVVSSTGLSGDDPPNDHSPSADNGVAGVVLGGNPSPVVHPYHYLESPAFNTSAEAGSVTLGFYRWLNSDYDPFMHNRVEVYNGSQWIVVWQTGASPAITDSPPAGPGWTYVSYDLTSYKNAGMKVRFGYDVGSSGVYNIGSWNVDDVLVASAACP